MDNFLQIFLKTYVVGTHNYLADVILFYAET